MRKRWLRSSLCLALAATVAMGAELHPTGNRTTPPTLNSVTPQGIARGTTAEMTVEGTAQEPACLGNPVQGERDSGRMPNGVPG